VSEPNIEVLGVYRFPPPPEQLVRERLNISYGKTLSDPITAEEAEESRDFFDSLVLIEVLVRNRDARFDVGKFTQRDMWLTPDNWQVAWAEAFLTMDGEALAVRRFGPMPSSGDLRIVFYFHCFKPAVPLKSSYGDLVCPAPTAMPERLARLVPYELP
jgi:hypothetical protein